jgi:hypothetical protein
VVFSGSWRKFELNVFKGVRVRSQMKSLAGKTNGSAPRDKILFMSERVAG